MDAWQKLRLERAKCQEIYVTSIDCTDDSLIFTVQGVSDDYMIEVNQDVELWPPRCDCDDNYFRPDILCKHTLLCLALMGVDGQCLEDCCWEGPTQYELYEYLSNAPDCVGCGIAADRIDSQRRESIGRAPDSQERTR